MYGIAIHRKGSREHAHLLVAAVDGRGKALDDSFLKIRTERLARELEYDLGENPTLGRHFSTSVKFLRKTRPEVAGWLVQAFGENPDKPVSALTPGARNRARKANFNISKANLAIRNAWSVSNGDPGDFAENLRKLGLQVTSGSKSGVWVICDGSGLVVGSVDRILRIRRAEIRTLFETTLEKPSWQTLKEPKTPSSASTLKSNSKPPAPARQRQRNAVAALRAFGRSLDLPKQARGDDGIVLVSSPLFWDLKDIWGVPIPPPRRIVP